ncbi:Hypothetical predicted protein [Mytilus galloprovincialis]|uniref:Roc domain-containing protein n=1 Tax=Mytilus galloprovincialis TaxID=29158 RepID=A0A8B6GPL0_MYTGA|nr:Hypothetical predicted protein [Mytilus galloprovincialis]
MTKWLIERVGMDPSIKTSKGATPFDLAKHHEYSAVMEYLKTVMTDLVEDVSPTTSGQIHSAPNFEDNKIPIGIKLMSDKEFVPLYLKLLESGSEKKKDIRLVVVGKKGTGKTSLVKRLLGEDIHNVRLSSTNGIDIHKIRCKANYNDGEWYKLDGNNEETERHARLLKPYKETLISQSKRHMDASVEAKSIKVDHPIGFKQQPSHLLLEQAFKEIESMLQSKIDLHDKEEYATLFLWDFAGDEEFYHTHQTFLSPDAIYLVLANLNEADDKKAQGNDKPNRLYCI